MSGKPVSPAEERRILAQPSPLQRRTREILIGACRAGDRMIPERDSESRQDVEALRASLALNAHVAWCKCVECLAKEAAE